MTLRQKIIETTQSVANSYNNSAWWRMQFASRVLSGIHRIAFRNETRVDILEEDWNNLFVLDACRPDLFTEVANIEEFDQYEVRNSMGSGTHEWTRRTFSGSAIGDLIYVTASPVVSRNIRTSVFHLEEVWKTDFDPELGTVPAEPVLERAQELQQVYPEKRLLVHLLQPHYPFIGNPSLQFTSFRGTDEFDVKGSGKAADVWEALALGLVTEGECWEGYKQNLEYVLDVLLPMIGEFNGKSVITSDHGNLLGERPMFSPIKIYGHPNGIRHQNLSTVPWAVVDNRETSSSESEESNLSVEEKLESLGYV